MTNFAKKNDMEKEIKTLADLTPDGENFNRHTEFGQKLLDDSLRKFGAGRSILVDKDGNIIAGNSTAETAAAIGMEDVIVVPSDGKKLVVVQRTDLTLDSPKGRELALADNMTALKGIDLDLDKVRETLGDDLAKAWGMAIPDVADKVTEDDFDPDKEHYDPVTKAGDIILLGDHRLMCGDSTSREDFSKLMNGEKADIAFTSPPYGVNDGRLREHKVAGQSSNADDNFYIEYDDNMGTWPTLIEESWQRMNENSDQQFINIQMLRDNKRELAQWCARHADNLCDILIWDKNRAAPQMCPNIVNNTFEFIYVFGEKDATRVLKYGNFRGNVSAIVRVCVGQNEYADIHKAVFPVALPGEILKINGNAKSVLDCFGGTGTTLIACEQLGRKCYMMEIDPNYCDVIIARWEKLTGKKAERIQSNGND